MYSLKSNIQKDCFTQLVLFHNFAKTYTTKGPHESFWLTWYKGFHNYVYCTIYCSTRYMTFIDIKFNLQIAMRHHSKVNCNSISGSWENCFKFFQMQPFFLNFVLNARLIVILSMQSWICIPQLCFIQFSNHAAG